MSQAELNFRPLPKPVLFAPCFAPAMADLSPCYAPVPIAKAMLANFPVTDCKLAAFCGPSGRKRARFPLFSGRKQDETGLSAVPRTSSVAFLCPSSVAPIFGFSLGRDIERSRLSADDGSPRSWRRFRRGVGAARPSPSGRGRGKPVPGREPPPRQSAPCPHAAPDH